MNVKKIDVPAKLYEYRDNLKEIDEVINGFKKFDIVYVEKKSQEPFIGIIVDNYGFSGYIIKYIDENGQYVSTSFTGDYIKNITLVEKQNPTEIKNDCDF